MTSPPRPSVCARCRRPVRRFLRKHVVKAPLEPLNHVGNPGFWRDAEFDKYGVAPVLVGLQHRLPAYVQGRVGVDQQAAGGPAVTYVFSCPLGRDR